MSNENPNKPAMDACAEVHRLASEYVESWTFEGETEEGADASYTPTANERGMIECAIIGLIADDEFIEAIVKWHAAQLAARKP